MNTFREPRQPDWQEPVDEADEALESEDDDVSWPAKSIDRERRPGPARRRRNSRRRGHSW